jgi:hypothetical protein
MLPNTKEVLWLETAYVCLASLTPQEWLTTAVYDWFVVCFLELVRNQEVKIVFTLTSWIASLTMQRGHLLLGACYPAQLM